MNGDLLTLQMLKDMAPCIIASGEVENSPDGVYMTESHIGRKLLWVAKRGEIHDWTIYIHWADCGLEYVLEYGDKVFSNEYIKKLVPCDAEALKMYRF